MAQAEYIPEYSIQDYLLWEGDWELWNGIPVSMSPSPNFRHQKIGSRILVAIQAQLTPVPCSNGCVAVYEMDWHVNDHTVVRPDIMIVCKEPEGDFVDESPALVAEVLSPSTRTKDLTSKKDLYASSGVKYYLIFDPAENQAQVLELSDTTYRGIPTDSELELDEDCRISLNVEDVFR
ncbi:MAG: Uma2 family endonuclease [Verrucomicrobiales bacterium]|nr:Uma2 family endonuclease [Verrucomicrobiales bacterium]